MDAWPAPGYTESSGQGWCQKGRLPFRAAVLWQDSMERLGERSLESQMGQFGESIPPSPCVVIYVWGKSMQRSQWLNWVISGVRDVDVQLFNPSTFSWDDLGAPHSTETAELRVNPFDCV